MATRGLVRWILAATLLFFSAAATTASAQIKVSVFNFGTLNLEASGYGTTATNMLMTSLGAEPSLAVLDRKELEAFLSLNDLQQDDNLDNVVAIGTRLGINMIVVGNVEKKGSIIIINSKVIHVESKKAFFSTQLRALGDAGLVGEIRKLSSMITAAIKAQAAKRGDEGKAALKGPVRVQKRGGNKRVFLSWEDSPDTRPAGYEVFRSAQEAGPYVKIGESTKPEYADQDLESGKTYFYKVRAFDARGGRSDYSAVVSAETAPTPNPPVILRTESHVRSIMLTWSPNPSSSGDPAKLVGYKLYRAKVEEGPYREVANILGKDLGIGIDSATTLDKLLKVNVLDKGLADGEDYFYKVTACNEKNLESEFSASLKGRSLPVVSGLAAQGDMIREILLRWNPLDSPFTKGYSIYRSTSENADFKKIRRLDSYDVGADKKIAFTDRDGLGDKIRYYYCVTAFEEGDQETSASVTVSAVTRGKPPTPQGFKAQSGLVKRIELSWAPSTADDVEGYNLYWSKEKVGRYSLLKKIDGRDQGRYTDSGRGFDKLADNATIFYTLSTFNKVDVESDLSEAVSATTKPRPAKPSGLTAQERKVKSVPLSWKANPENDIAQYLVFRAEGASGQDYSQIARLPGKTEYQDKELKDGALYRYRIQAEDRDGLISDFSEPVTVSTKPRPKSPEGLSGEFKDGKAELRWKAGPEADLARYNVYEKRFLGREKIGSSTQASYGDASIVPGKPKTYAITSVDRDGLESEPSQELVVSPPK
ncbi:MAG TPA: hypothetical protein PLB96_02105 [Syntrophales bacterium]|nr:hypothetical protein [Syntrophales bacterium]